ncbi:molybdopterin molybdotransferase MoeA [Texcoconibacillus texcoconensis]|uniref:Molybdopterin molybdenumtransferase n=1 Tax=Texcoconibacillus texcoconensis TaxID=1095777 RepID=A0A840QSQ3_9BACI|nr:gephyrin-like molybdotransferase Glp [Texcoconibacillus texcoconensis]MBB5174321.1 molybdopterin molybdotransferase [Texcoconibacillus texcoconensis]
MIEKRQAISIYDAIARVMKYKVEGDIEWVDIDDADNRYLAEPIRADHDIPPFDRSPLDGYAIKAEDTDGAGRENPVKLEVIETIGAGEVASKIPERGQAVRVMTGTLLPEGTDTIVMFELAREQEHDGKSYIQITRSFSPGDYVSFRGEETEKGQALVERGKCIDAGVKALLATFGYKRVPVRKRPIVGIYATGTELLDVDEPLESGKIRNSNSYMVTTQVRQAGGIPKYYGKLMDDFDTCFNAVSKSLEEVDVLITTGGVSVGDFDYLPRIYEKLGADVLFNKIAMRPGSVTTAAAYNGKLLFGLSGNPSACFVGFELYARPWVQTYIGSSKPYLQRVKATMTKEFLKPNPFTRFIRSKTRFEGDCLTVEPAGLDKSQVVTSLAHTNALAVLPGGSRGYETGTKVDALLLGGEGSTEPLDDRNVKKER